MLFTIGIETPANENEAYGIAVPALSTEKYDCFSAADTLEEIPAQATDAIHSILEMMFEDGLDINNYKTKAIATIKRLKISTIAILGYCLMLIFPLIKVNATALTSACLNTLLNALIAVSQATRFTKTVATF